MSSLKNRSDYNSWKSFLGCPECLSPTLHFVDITLQCTACNREFSIESGIPSMLSSEERLKFDRISSQYRQRRIKQGWRAMTLPERLDLPNSSPTGYDKMYWNIRRQSFQMMVKLLSNRIPPQSDGMILDLGAGNGWMSYQMARAGYRVAALETSLDPDFGLGNIDDYREKLPGRIFPIRGTFEKPPFLPGCASAVIFNASLHYTNDLTGTLRHVSKLLCPGGCIVVVDSPVSKTPKRGTTFGDRHIGCQELHDAFSQAGFKAQWTSIGRGLRWFLFQMGLRLRKKNVFSFPIIIAEKK